MKKNVLNKNIPLLVTVLLNVCLFVAVIFLMKHVQFLLYSDAKINLTEIVTQNKDVINSKITLEVNNLDLVSNQLSDYLKKQQTVDDTAIRNTFLRYCVDSEEDSNLFVSGVDGMAYSADGSTANISGRRYFRLAMEGNQNISDRTVSRLTGEDIFVISVPLKLQGKIIGTVQKSYTPEEMYALCSVSLFSAQGSMYIINSEGYILISSDHLEYNSESENYFRSIYAKGNKEASAQFENDIQNNKAGFMETEVDGKKIFSAYTPIEDLHDWYLISSVATEAVSPNANIVIKLFYFILSVVVIVFGSSVLYFLVYKNKQQANLEHVAFVDSVTDGNTYNKFLVDVKEILVSQPEKPFFLMAFDIDNFKYVNNYYGFDFGDRILHRIYQTFSEKLLPNEIMARISGDHFVVLLENADTKRLEGLLSSMQEEDGVVIYFSAGIYNVMDHNESVNLMVDKAGTAAQTVKDTFHKRVGMYSNEFDEVVAKNEHLKRAVERAFQNDEMIPYFQPKVDVNSRQLVGAEALARWKTPEGKLVPPGDFIPLCEKTGLVVELDMLIFEKVLQFLQKNLDQGIDCVPISVNFSRMHLLDNEFLDKIVRKIEEYQVPANLIEIELTETIIYDNLQMISEFTKRLHEKGLLISMDDFGSGYSSLNMLKDIPIDILKVDRDFLGEAMDTERRNIIFSTIAEMANKLRIKVVVEGVENLENVELMQKCGCSIAQGYYFARPMDEGSFESVFKEGRV